MMITWVKRKNLEDLSHREFSNCLRSHGYGQRPSRTQDHGTHGGKDKDKECIPVTKLSRLVKNED